MPVGRADHTAEYWNRRAAAFLGTSREAGAVCDSTHLVGPGNSAPIEERGVRLVESHLPPRARTLEVGCGYGRWFGMMSRDRPLIGVDFSPVLVRHAAKQRKVPVVLGDARYLPVAGSSLDAIYTIKVLQHLHPRSRPPAVAAIVGAVRPGGTVILFEQITRTGSPPGDWIRWAERAGGRLVRWYGNQFAPVDRMLVRMARAVRPAPAPAPFSPASRPAPDARERRAWLTRRFDGLRSLELRLFLPAEPLFERMLPRAWAEHGIFVFERIAPR
jgi:SAM-dependent methyltransferase